MTEIDYRNMAQYKEGFHAFKEYGYTIPDSPYETPPSKTAWLVGWLDARSLTRLGKKHVDWINYENT